LVASFGRLRRRDRGKTGPPEQIDELGGASTDGYVASLGGSFSVAGKNFDSATTRWWEATRPDTAIVAGQAAVLK